MRMPLLQRAAAALRGSGTLPPGLRGGLRLTLTASHIVRGVIIVATQFPSQDAKQLQVLVQCWSCEVQRALGVGVQFRGSLDQERRCR